ncbi:hypothetical protein G9F72_014015 [Clostridium estertheticum]|uniref:XAC2610-related protein n=1 Tax=Clostridium estertheticum TaxID=238834 RepID=UPI0013E953B6|nr:hypothetical protein [Clostridium estertheticum]MBZ9687442.1 hypothetical protein [Clostridium estertheticum]
MKIYNRISIGLSCVLIALLCSSCSKNTNPQSQLTEPKTQPANNGNVEVKKNISTEPISEKPTKSSIEPFIVLKDKIHPSFPEYKFKVYGQKKDALYSASKIEVYNEVEKKVQELAFSATSTPDGNQLGIVIEDMNFDGYKDIRIQQFLPATANVPYYYWLWDKETSKFIKNNELEKITSPVFDSESKLIKSNVKGNAGTYYDYEYKYIDSKPTLIREIERIADLEKNLWHITIKELVEKEMRVTKKYDEKIK